MHWFTKLKFTERLKDIGAWIAILALAMVIANKQDVAEIKGRLEETVRRNDRIELRLDRIEDQQELILQRLNQILGVLKEGDQ